MARVKSRLTGEAADFDAPETKEDIIDLSTVFGLCLARI